jgi:hypothetical protein
MATLYWFGGSGNWDSSDNFNWSTAAPTAMTGSMVGTNTLTVSAVTGTALAIGKAVLKGDGTFAGIITGGSGSSWTLDTVGTFAASPMGAGTRAASAPTSADDVIFNANSGNATGGVGVNVITGAVCKSINASAVTANTYFNGGNVDVYGAINIGAAATYVSTPMTFDNLSTTAATAVTISAPNFCRALYYTGATTYTQAASFISADSSSDFGIVQIGAGATVTFSGGCSCGKIILNGGSLTTGAFSHTIANSLQDLAGNSTLNASSSTFTIGSGAPYSGEAIWAMGNFGGTVLTTNVSTAINLGSSTPGNSLVKFYGGDESYLGSVDIRGTGSELYGNNTFSAFTRIGATDASSYLYISGNQTITGNSLIQGRNAGSQRLFMASAYIGSPATLTMTSATGLSKQFTWVDLQDITLTITGAAISPTSTGDCGGNTTPGGSFNVPVTCYAKVGASPANYSDFGIWFTTSGGSTSLRVPLPQDTVVFDANTGAGAITVDVRTLGKNVSISGYTTPFVYSYGAGTFIYGSLTGADAASVLGNLLQLVFAARSTVSVASLSNIQQILFYGYNGVYNLTGDITTLNGFIVSANNAVLTASTYNITCVSLTLDFYSTIGSPGYGYSSLGGDYSGTSGSVTVSSLYIGANTSYSHTAGTITLQGQNTPGNIGLSVSVTSTTTFWNLNFNGFGLYDRFFGLQIAKACTYNSWTSTSTYPVVINFVLTNTQTIGTLNMSNTPATSVFIGYGLWISSSLTNLANTTSRASIALVNPATTAYTMFKSIAVTGAALTANQVADFGNNSGISFASNLRAIVYTGNVGSDATGSFVMPTNASDSNMVLAVGGGGGAAKRNTVAGAGGGASGQMAISYNLPISGGQTIYYQAGAGGAGVVGAVGGSGGNGGESWINIAANSAPFVNSNGVRAFGGSGSLLNSNQGGAEAAFSNIGMLGSGSTRGSSANTLAAGGGGAAPSLKYRQGLLGSAGSAAVTGGPGGGGQRTAGGSGSGSTGGNGGSNLIAGVASGGTAGLTGTAGTLGGGGGGGGGGSGASAAGNGGYSDFNNEFTSYILNGAFATTTIGPSGGGGAGGYNGTGVAGRGGSSFIGGGGGGGGGGSTVANNGGGGDGGVGMIVVLYTYSSGVPNQGMIIG